MHRRTRPRRRDVWTEENPVISVEAQVGPAGPETAHCSAADGDRIARPAAQGPGEEKAQ